MTGLGGRGLGLLPDLEDVVQSGNTLRPLHRMVGLTGTSPPRPLVVDRRTLLDRILDQGPTNACVGCALSTAVFLRGMMTDHPVARPSAKAFYDLARMADGTDADVLMDWGCRPDVAVVQAGKHGMTTWEDWPLETPDDPDMLALRAAPDAPWVNTPPDMAVFRKSFDARLENVYRADTGDIQATLELALAQGHFPLYGQVVAHDYQDVRGRELYDVATDEPPDGLGAHMQAICGFDREAFLVVSSWGEGHGDRGIVRVAKRVVCGSWSFGRMVVTQSPKEVGST